MKIDYREHGRIDSAVANLGLDNLLASSHLFSRAYTAQVTAVCFIIMENCFFLVLISTSFAKGKQLSDQSRAVSMLRSLHFPFDVIDGSDLANKEM